MSDEAHRRAADFYCHRCGVWVTRDKIKLRMVNRLTQNDVGPKTGRIASRAETRPCCPTCKKILWEAMADDERNS